MSEKMHCPFCGSSRIGVHYGRTRVKSGFQACCLECKVSQTSTYHPSIEVALEAWNTRTHPASQPLTDEEHERLMRGRSTLDYGRAVEKAHGIGGEA